MGPTKRALSGELMERLRAHYGSGGLVHYGQGKWYPGEQLPRWSLNLFWRRDGVPIWHDPALLASERDDHGATAGQGARVPASPGAAPRRRPAQRLRRLRRPRLLPLARRQAADQCRADRFAPRPTRPSATACARCSSAASASRSATRCRSPSTSSIRSAGARRPGTCATTTASWSRAIRRSAFACRSIRCRGRVPAICPGSIRPTPTSICRRFLEMAARRSGRRGRVARLGRARRAEVGRARDAERHARRRQRRRQAAPARGAPEVERIGRLRRPHRDQRRGAPRPALHLHAADVGARGLPRARRRRRGDREGDAPAGDARRLRAAARSAPRAAARHAGPGRDRGQRQPGDGLERAGRADDASLRRRARDAPDDREVHARRPPHRHRRRQPLRPRRRDAGRLAVPAPTRPARQHDRLLAQPSGAELPVLGHVRRPDEPGAAHRRGAERLGLRDRGRVRRARPRRRGRAPGRRRRG